jgi:hypothetical protein
MITSWKNTPVWERWAIVGSTAVVLVSTAAACIAGNYGENVGVGSSGWGGGDYGHTTDYCGTECGTGVVYGRASDSGLRGAARTGPSYSSLSQRGV